MTALAQKGAHLIDRLPRVRGRLTANAPLATVTWFRVGGPAEVLFRPADGDDLAAFLAGTPHDVPVTVLGKACAGLTAVAGILIIAMPTGILAAAFSEAMQKRKRPTAPGADG